MDKKKDKYTQAHIEFNLNVARIHAITFKGNKTLTVKEYSKSNYRFTFTDGTLMPAHKAFDQCVAFYYYPKATSKKSSALLPAVKKAKVEKPRKVFSIYNLASGKTTAKKFTIKQFLQITKNAKKKPSGPNTSKKLKLDDGYVYQADSQQEISILKKLISHDAFKRLRGQCISIPYQYGGKKHNYYPDFIMLTQTNKIVLMEVKEIAQMNSKQNIKKYEAMKRYCEKQGYLYIMCDKMFVPFGKLSETSGSKKIKNTIDEVITKKGHFGYSDYKELIKDKTQSQIKLIRKTIGIYVASHKNVKMNGDLTFNIAKFRIVKKEHQLKR